MQGNKLISHLSIGCKEVTIPYCSTMAGYMWSSKKSSIFGHVPILFKGPKIGCQGRRLEKIGSCGIQTHITKFYLP
eukprot:2412013-Ditylum_brightwellii.AAC.1